MVHNRAHDAITGESFQDHHPPHEEALYSEKRREAGKEAFKKAPFGRKMLERAKARADEALKQVKVNEDLHLSAKFLREYDAMEEEYKRLQAHGDLNTIEGLALKRRYKTAFKTLKAVLGQHIDEALVSHEERMKAQQVLREIDVLQGAYDQPDFLPPDVGQIDTRAATAGYGVSGSQPPVEIAPKSVPAASEVPEARLAPRKPKVAREVDEDYEDSEARSSTVSRIDQERAAARGDRTGLDRDQIRADREKRRQEVEAQREKMRQEREKRREEMRLKREEMERERQSIREKREVAQGAFNALKAYTERHQAVSAKLSQPAGDLTFGLEQKELPLMLQSSKKLGRTLEEKVRDKSVSKEDVRKHSEEVLTWKISAEQTLGDFERVHDRALNTAKTSSDLEGKIGDIFEANLYLESVETPEERLLSGQLESLEKLEGDFNAANSVEVQNATLDELDRILKETAASLPVFQEIITKTPALEDSCARLEGGFGELERQMTHLEKVVKETPTAWSTEALLGKEGGVLDKASHFWDQLRDNVYHARLFGGETTQVRPPVNFDPERVVLRKVWQELNTLKLAFDNAATPEARLKALRAYEAKDEALSKKNPLDEVARKLGEKYAAVNQEKPPVNESYLGRLVGAFGGNLKEIGSRPAHTGVLNYALQEGLGALVAVEGLAKWGVGVAAGVPGLIQTVPQFLARGVTGDFKGARAAVDNNTLTGTLTTLVYDLPKAAVGLVSWPLAGRENGFTQWALGKKDTLEGNHFSQAMSALYGASKEFVNPKGDQFLNGFQLGQVLGTGLTIGAGPQAMVGAQTALRTVAPRLGTVPRVGATLERVANAAADLQLPQGLPRLRLTVAPQASQISEAITALRGHLATLGTAAEQLSATNTVATQVIQQLDSILSRIGNRSPDISQAIQATQREIQEALRDSNHTADGLLTIMESTIQGAPGNPGLMRYATAIDSFTATSFGPGASAGNRLSEALRRTMNRLHRRPPSLSTLPDDVLSARTQVTELLAAGEGEAAMITAEAFGNRMVDDIQNILNQTRGVISQPTSAAIEAGLNHIRTALRANGRTPQSVLQAIDDMITRTPGFYGINHLGTLVDSLSILSRDLSRTSLRELEQAIVRAREHIVALDPNPALATSRTFGRLMVEQLRHSAQRIRVSHPNVAADLETAANNIHATLGGNNSLAMLNTLETQFRNVRGYGTLVDEFLSRSTSRGVFSRLRSRTRSLEDINYFDQEFRRIGRHIRYLNRAGHADLALETARLFAQRFERDLNFLISRLNKVRPPLTDITNELQQAIQRTQAARTAAGATSRTITDEMATVAGLRGTPGFTRYAETINAALSQPSRTVRWAGRSVTLGERTGDQILTHPRSATALGGLPEIYTEPQDESHPKPESIEMPEGDIPEQKEKHAA